MIERRRLMSGSKDEAFVDLGLPSGALWAKCNIGADNPWEVGMYFSWSNTEGHYASEGYNFSSANYSNTLGSKVRRTPFWNANSLTGEDGFDAARENVGDWWFVPQRDNYIELVNNTDQEWVSNYQNTGVSGMKFINRNNSSKYIFMPEVGHYSDTTYTKDSNYSRYWMADRYDDGNDRPNARFFRIYSDGSTNCNGYNFGGYLGCQIRPVYREPGNNWDFKTSVMFQIKALVSGNIGWRCGVNDSTWFKELRYSKNGGAWTTITSSYSTNGTTISVTAGDIVKFTAYTSDTVISESATNYNQFTSTCRCEVSGNIMLLYSRKIIMNPQNVSIPTNGLFCSLFINNSNLVNAENLYLPAHTLTSDCYRSMFYGCTGMTKAPELPAATPAERSYRTMFYGCTNLNYIKCLATDISATDCTAYWVNNVAQSGTFVKASGVSWPSGTSGIPSGWTVEEV